MRWILRLAGLLAIVWLLFLASPLVALHNFAREIEARDVEAIRERVNFRALRISLLKQVMGVVVQERGGRTLDPSERQLAVEVGAGLADPVVAQLLTPEAIVELLNGAWPSTLREDGAAGEGEASPPSIVRELRLRSLNAGWRLFRASELRGFRSIIVSLPPDRPQERQVRLRLRLARGSWKLVSIDLPPALLSELARRLPGPRRQAPS
jgi:Protein of unknown function (DUF2939)